MKSEGKDGKKCKWEFRGIQLDLAGQMETMEYIRSFIDFASRYNYNKLSWGTRCIPDFS